MVIKMHRYKLRCGDCGMTIGYMSLPGKPVDDYSVIDKVTWGDSIEPICCPFCEVRRKNNER